MPTIDEIVSDEVIQQLQNNFQANQPVDLVNKTNLDPFGMYTGVPPNPLGQYDFSQIQPNQVASFFTQMDLMGGNAVPQVNNIPPNGLVADNNKIHAGIPRIQHSVWVGEPLNGQNTQLNGPNPKKQAFMHQLALNKANNPNWEVVLWTDQPRDKFHQIPVPPEIAGMKQWAQQHGIKLASIDEIYGDPANRMQLHEQCKLESNKGGTGRAAVSDMVRLEVLSRFGGLYVDGDKPFKTQLDNVLTQASQSQIPLNGNTHTNFLSANEAGTPQNCSLISEKDSPVVNGIMNHIKGEYAKDRTTMISGTSPIVDQARPQRVEIIARTGPSAIKAITQGNGLMDQSYLQSYTGTTSWSQEDPHTGYKVLANANQMDVNNLARFDNVAQQGVLNNAPTLANLPNFANYTQQQQQRIGEVVRSSLTSLSYTITNENGRLDLRHLQPHLAKLPTDEERRVATHAILTALYTPEFQGTADKITEISVPPNMPGITEESMDLLMDAQKFPNARLDTYCVQRAALRGDVAMLNYARNNHVSLSETPTSRVDAGFVPGKMWSEPYTPLRAAVMGGQNDALKFVLADTQSQNVTQAIMDDRRAALELAGTMGRTDMMALITDVATTHAQTLVEPDRSRELAAIGKSLNTAKLQLDKSEHLKFRVPITNADKMFGRIPTGPTGNPCRDLALGQGPLLNQTEQQLETMLKTQLYFPPTDITVLRNLVNPPSLRGGIIEAVTTGQLDNATRNNLVAQVKQFGATNLENKLDNTPALSGVSEISKMSEDLNGWIQTQGDETLALQRATQLGVQGSLMVVAANNNNTAMMSTALTSWVQDQGGETQALANAGTLGIEEKILNVAAVQGNTRLLTESLNGERPLNEQVVVGQFDLEAEIAVAHANFPNSEQNKNAYKQINTANSVNFSADQVKAFAQQALVYSHDRLRADSKGSQSRVDGWAKALQKLSDNNPLVANDQGLQDLVDHAKRQVEGVNAPKHVRSQLRTEAKDFGGPQLSQREGTSTGGKIRDFFKNPDAPAPLNTPHVPGKRI